MGTQANTGKAFWIVAGVVISISILVLLAVLAFISGDASRTTTINGRVPAVVDEDPATRAAAFGMVEVSGTNQAVARVGHVVASGRTLPGESLSSVWISPDGTEVLEVFESGLTVLTEIPEIGPNPLKYVAAVVADAASPSVYITMINGVQALAVEPNTDELGTNPGLVRFEYEGYSVVVSGKDMAVKYLVDVAAKLQPVEFVGISPD